MKNLPEAKETSEIIAQKIAETLPGVAKKDYGEKYNDHLLEQYKIYLLLADKISERRSTTNSFFLTINTGLISAMSFTKYFDISIPTPLIVIVSISAITLCYSWYCLIRSYKDLNSAKFKVIHEIEKNLPIRPYDSEWEAVGRGNDKELYLPFTHIEIFVPWVFMALYIVLVVFGIFQSRF